MLSIDILKSFISHPDQLVRRKVMDYIYRGNIKDRQILSLALNVYEKYNDTENLHLLYHCGRQYIDDISAERLFEILKKTDDESAEMHAANLLCNANLSWLKKNIAKMKPRNFADFSIAENRLELANYSSMQLWERLKGYAGQCDKDDEMYSVHILDSIIEALASHSFPDEDTICELLQLERGRDRYMEVFLVELAGAKRLNQATPFICEMLTDEDSNADEWCVTPLSLIGSVEVVDTLKENFLKQSWSYKLSALDILRYIKIPESEQAIIELLAHKDSHSEDIYFNLCFSLCDQLSAKAIDICTSFIDEPEACQIGSLREELLAISQIHGIDIPQADEWRQQVEEDYERQFRLQSEFGKTSAGFREKFEQIEKQTRIEEFNQTFYEACADEMDEFDSDHPGLALHCPTLRSDNKVGRNESCPCGSGKKYKKCCGSNN